MRQCNRLWSPALRLTRAYLLYTLLSLMPRRVSGACWSLVLSFVFEFRSIGTCHPVVAPGSDHELVPNIWNRHGKCLSRLRAMTGQELARAATYAGEGGGQ